MILKFFGYSSSLDVQIISIDFIAHRLWLLLHIHLIFIWIRALEGACASEGPWSWSFINFTVSLSVGNTLSIEFAFMQLPAP